MQRAREPRRVRTQMCVCVCVSLTVTGKKKCTRGRNRELIACRYEAYRASRIRPHLSREMYNPGSLLIHVSFLSFLLRRAWRATAVLRLHIVCEIHTYRKCIRHSYRRLYREERGRRGTRQAPFLTKAHQGSLAYFNLLRG